MSQTVEQLLVTVAMELVLGEKFPQREMKLPSAELVAQAGKEFANHVAISEEIAKVIKKCESATSFVVECHASKDQVVIDTEPRVKELQGALQMSAVLVQSLLISRVVDEFIASGGGVKSFIDTHRGHTELEEKFVGVSRELADIGMAIMDDSKKTNYLKIPSSYLPKHQTYLDVMKRLDNAVQEIKQLAFLHQSASRMYREEKK